MKRSTKSPKPIDNYRNTNKNTGNDNKTSFLTSLWSKLGTMFGNLDNEELKKKLIKMPSNKEFSFTSNHFPPQKHLCDEEEFLKDVGTPKFDNKRTMNVEMIKKGTK